MAFNRIDPDGGQQGGDSNHNQSAFYRLSVECGFTTAWVNERETHKTRKCAAAQ